MRQPHEKKIVHQLIEMAAKNGIDWEPELKALGEGPFTSRQVCDAIGAAATRLGIRNNLVKK